MRGPDTGISGSGGKKSAGVTSVPGTLPARLAGANACTLAAGRGYDR
jgi:hypothetical protein